jgi:hypothetical protein
MSAVEVQGRPSVHCIECGFFSKRTRMVGNFRPHAGFHELDPGERDNLAADFHFPPGETNALQHGELACFRHKLNFPEAIASLDAERGITGSEAAREVANAPRECAEWCQYQPGISPADHLSERKANDLERDRREFAVTLSKFQARLGDQERRVTVRIGVLALLVALVAVTPDSLGVQALHWLAINVKAAFTAVRALLSAIAGPFA